MPYFLTRYHCILRCPIALRLSAFKVAGGYRAATFSSLSYIAVWSHSALHCKTTAVQYKVAFCALTHHSAVICCYLHLCVHQNSQCTGLFSAMPCSLSLSNIAVDTGWASISPSLVIVIHCSVLRCTAVSAELFIFRKLSVKTFGWWQSHIFPYLVCSILQFVSS